jgi:hypothetical protein
MSMKTRQNRARKRHVSRRGHAPPTAAQHSRRRQRWRNRWLRGGVWVLAILFVASVAGFTVALIRR